MKKSLLLLSLALTTACAVGPYPTSSPYFQIPAGSHLILKQTLTILPNLGRVYIQYSKVVTGKEKNQYYPHCWFVSWTISPNETRIVPDDFIITASKKNESYVSREKPIALSSSEPIRWSGIAATVMAVEYSTTLTIHSGKQPDIRQFICNHWEDPMDAQHLSLSQINAALGDIAEIKLQ